MLIKFLDGTEREVPKLAEANLRRADLSRADLSGANLRGADLRGANLRGADLIGAILSVADLSGADLSGADLRRANLRGANLRGADLSRADLSGADLSRADLSGANLHGANLKDAKGLAQFTVCPEIGAFFGFKKVGGIVITLLIPADAKRVNAYGSRKCRAEFAYVMSPEAEGNDAYNGFIYPASGLVTPDSYDPDPRVECSHGIHFFITRAEAQEYY